jgi:16S rRNA (cytidine1402-2'-O)-methyltransferase
VSALVVSGLPTDRFLYVGFLPRRSSERRALLTELAPLSITLICFEAPHRLVETLTDALEILGNRRIAVAKDLTKLHETVLRTDISQAQAHFTTQLPRGEFTLVIAGREHPEPERQRRQPTTTITAAETAPATDETAIAERLYALRDQGQSGSAAARTVARELGLQKSEVYQIWLKLFAD